MSWKNKVILITGASSGIGRDCARYWAREGALLCLGARRMDRLQELKSELSALTEVFISSLDVADPTSIDQFVAASLERFHRLDVVLVNAGFAVTGELATLPDADLRRQCEVNLFGALHTVRATWEALKKTRGRLGLIGSVNSYVSVPSAGAYSISKFAIRAAAEALYHEGKPHGISVTLICPGLVESEIRQVDNAGRFHEQSPDPVPSWIKMKGSTAARKIVRAIKKRKRERILTFHGWLGIKVKSHFPHFFHLMITLLKVRAGRQKSSAARPLS
jgi:short-subunit dehydrogenase